MAVWFESHPNMELDWDMQPKIIPRSEHPISRNSIDPDAMKVLYRLYRAGHTAYLVGGGVRDLLVNLHPKDFDIVTSARPAQVRKLFRNCRLIGRRFRLAHIHFPSGKIIELSTFRGQPDLSGDPESEDRLVRSDNVFGTPRRDAERRDFTINSLFYDIATFSLIDYVGAMDDVKSRIVRTIGEPRLRFQEDPVRMIRAIKFVSRLNFAFEPETWEAILELSSGISRSARPRIVEEMCRLLEEGASERALELLYRSGLLAAIEPVLNEYLARAQQDLVESDPGGQLLFRLLRGADQMRSRGLRLARPLLLCIWAYPVLHEIDYMSAENPERAAWDCLQNTLGALGFARKDIESALDILMMLRRMLVSKKRSRGGKKVTPQMANFAEALLLLSLLSQAGSEGTEDLDRWASKLPEIEELFRVKEREVLPPPPPQPRPEVAREAAPNSRRKLRRRPGQPAAALSPANG